MKTKKEVYEKEIVKIIKDNNLFIISDIFAYYTGIQSSQFYNLELEKSVKIKKAIDDNKVKTRQSMKNKWFKSDNATLQIGLMKIVGTEEDAHRLNGSKQEFKKEVIEYTPEERQARIDLLESKLKNG